MGGCTGDIWSWLGWKRKLRDGFCGEMVCLKTDAHLPACPAGGSNREDCCGEPESAGRRTKTQCVECSSIDLRR